MLTQRGRRTVALGLFAGLLGRVLGIPELFGLAAAAVVVAMAALVQVRLARRDVTVSARAVPPVVNAGEPARVEVTVEEAGPRRVFSTTVLLEAGDSYGPGPRQPTGMPVPGLTRSGLARVSFELPTLRRGVFTVNAYEAVLTDPLGLARRSLGSGPAATCVVVPRVEPIATVLPDGFGWVEAASARSAAERQITGSSTLRRYAQGDDMRRVHWRTTARVGELMVREGGDSDEVDRMLTTVLLDAGGEATPAEDLDRAVEVAASVLTAAAEASSARISGAFRLLTTTGVDIDGGRGHNDLQAVLVALAGVGAGPAPARERLRAAVGNLGLPDQDEALVIVGAFGQSPPDPAVLHDLARTYATVVVVLVGAELTPSARHRTARRADFAQASTPGMLESARALASPPVGAAQAGVLTVALPRGTSLAAAWSRGHLDRDQSPAGPSSTRADETLEAAL